MTRARDLSCSDDTSTSFYVHPLSALEGYRFPPEDEHRATLQSPPVTPSSPMRSHASPATETPGESVLLSNVPPSELDALWDVTSLFEGSSAFSGHMFSK